MSDKTTEAILDQLFAREILNNPAFSQFVGERTAVAHRLFRINSVRADNPWGTVTVVSLDPVSGLPIKIREEGETDILVIFDVDENERFALHIENKLANGSFMPDQAGRYLRRAEAWLHDKRYGRGACKSFQTMLLAPRPFQARNLIEAGKFHLFLAHEEVAAFIPAFAQAPVDIRTKDLGTGVKCRE